MNSLEFEKIDKIEYILKRNFPGFGLTPHRAHGLSDKHNLLLLSRNSA